MTTYEYVALAANIFLELLTFFAPLMLKGIKSQSKRYSYNLLWVIIKFIFINALAAISQVDLFKWISIGVTLVISLIECIIAINKSYKTFKQSEKELSMIGRPESNIKSYDGVFAASAIILTNDNKFILVKKKNNGDIGENFWVQPGSYIKTNALKRYDKNDNIPELPTLYSHLLKEMQRETGLTRNEYSFLCLDTMKNFSEEKTFSGIFTTYEDTNRDNVISPIPFLIQKEKSKVKKSSGMTVHIDCFFAFKLKQNVTEDFLQRLQQNSVSDDRSYSDIRAFDYEQIKKMALTSSNEEDKCYKDLVVILDKFIIAWRKNEFAKKYNSIRYCTFNPKKNTVWLRLGQKCNLSCKFCLLKDRAVCNTPIDANNINGLINKLAERTLPSTDCNLVVTGGETFLINNFTDIILALVRAYLRIKSVSICTNGTLWENHKEKILNLNRSLLQDGKILKFVINCPCYNSLDYADITQSSEDDDLFNKQKDFMLWLNKNNIPYTINVVLTRMIQNKQYEYMDYWTKTLGAKNIALSYAIRQGVSARHDESSLLSNLLLSKKECYEIYNYFGNGKYPIEKFNSFELMIPSCDEVNCKESNKIFSIDYNVNCGNIEIYDGCLDQIIAP